MKPVAFVAAHVLVAGGVLALYHVLVVEPARRDDLDEAAAVARAEGARIVADTAGRVRRQDASSAPSASALDRVEARLRALEEKAGVTPPAAEPAAPGPAPASAGPGGPAGWTEEQLASLRAMVEEIERRKQEERETESIRRRIEAQKVALTPDEEERVIVLARDYTRRLRESMPRGSVPPAERQAALAKMAGLREELRSSLSVFLPPETADAVMKAFPEPSRPR